ncbi:hypothetical protein [Bacillus phage SBSphiJ6]|nr:hypothetical protein [Bacillus phage SBSphiJ2]UPI12272.1 hypothetical protein [Bacillus phage SBSphiJ3]UPI13016.1 hypothetical protein [Bacillus phage SBSphiJ6]
MLTDLERVQQFYDWLGEGYQLEESEDIAPGCNQRLVIGWKGSWYWIYYYFKDGKLDHWYMSE